MSKVLDNVEVGARVCILQARYELTGSRRRQVHRQVPGPVCDCGTVIAISLVKRVARVRSDEGRQSSFGADGVRWGGEGFARPATEEDWPGTPSPDPCQGEVAPPDGECAAGPGRTRAAHPGPPVQKDPESEVQEEFPPGGAWGRAPQETR